MLPTAQRTHVISENFEETTSIPFSIRVCESVKLGMLNIRSDFSLKSRDRKFLASRPETYTFTSRRVVEVVAALSAVAITLVINHCGFPLEFIEERTSFIRLR